MAPLSLPDAGADQGPDVSFVVTVESPELGLDLCRTIPMHVKEQASLHKMLAAALADMAAAVSAGGVLDSTQDRSVLELLERERLKGGRVRQVSMYRLCQTCSGRLEPAAAQRSHSAVTQRSIATQTMNCETECSLDSEDEVNQFSKSLAQQVPDNVMHQQTSDQASVGTSQPIEISIGQRSPETSWKRAAAASATESCSGRVSQGQATGSPESARQTTTLASSQRSHDRIGTPVTTPHSSQRAGEPLSAGIYSDTLTSVSTGSPSRGRTLDKVENSRSPVYKSLKSPHCVELPAGMGLPISLSSTLEAVDMCSDAESTRSLDADGPTGTRRSRPPSSSCQGDLDDQPSKNRSARRDVHHDAAVEPATLMASHQAISAELATNRYEGGSSARRKPGSEPTSPDARAPHRRRSPMDDSFVSLAAQEKACTEVGPLRPPEVRLSRSLDSSTRRAASDAFRAASLGVKRKGSYPKGQAASRECSDRVRAACDKSDWKHADKAEGLHNTTRRSCQLSQLIFTPDFPSQAPPLLLRRTRSSSARMAATAPPSEVMRHTGSFERSDSARSNASLAQTLGTSTMPPRLPTRSGLHSPSPPPDRDMVQGMAIKKWLERSGSLSSTIS